MRIDSLRVVRMSASPAAGAARGIVGDEDGLCGAALLKVEGRAWVRRVRAGGLDIVVKCRPLHSIRRRIGSVLGMGHAHRQWSGAAQLDRAGVRTGEPLLIARGVIEGTPVELLALTFVDGPTLLEVLASVARGAGPDVRSQHAIARAAGGLLRRLAAAGLHNRDHKPSNLVVAQGPGGEESEPEMAVIDCVGIRRCGRLGIDEGEVEQMLASMMIEPMGCACPPRRALWMRALRELSGGGDLTRADRRSLLREMVGDVRALIRAHGDPKPKTNPLKMSGK